MMYVLCLPQKAQRNARSGCWVHLSPIKRTVCVSYSNAYLKKKHASKFFHFETTLQANKFQSDKIYYDI